MHSQKRLSVPIYRLKRRAKQLARSEDVPLHDALDRVARDEGYAAWSLLSARASEQPPGELLLKELNPGDLVLLGARPGHGKTLLGLELVLAALRQGRAAAFFTLEYSEQDMVERFRAVGADPQQLEGEFLFDNSDDISAGYVAQRLEGAPAGSVAVIDYLQLLDQKREHPELKEQVLALRGLARRRGVIMVCISQIDRRFEASARAIPELRDVRLPNPVDLTAFDKACFLNEGEISLSSVA